MNRPFWGFRAQLASLYSKGRSKTCYTTVVWTAILVLFMLIVPTYLEACPGCKNLDDPINKGFNWSILFMMAMPFTVFGLVGGTIFLHFNGNRLSAISNQWRLKVRNLLAGRDKR